MTANDAARAFLTTRLARVAALGHTLKIEHRPPPADHPEWRTKYWAVCTCGYRSTQRATEAMAVSTAVWHAAQVDAEGEAARVNGVERAAPQEVADTPENVPSSVGARL